VAALCMPPARHPSRPKGNVLTPCQLRDRQASFQFGKPIMVQEDCDVEPLEMEDLEGEMDKVQALFLLEQLKLAKLGSSLPTTGNWHGLTAPLATQ